MKQIHTGPGDSRTGLLKTSCLVALLAATGCVSTPPAGGDGDGVDLTNIRTVNVAGFVNQQLTNDIELVHHELPIKRSVLWGVLPGVYEQLGIPVATSNPQTFQVGNIGYEVQRVDGKRMNSYLNCGTSRGGPIANSHQVTLTVVTKLEEVSEQLTKMTTLVSGTAVHRSTAGYPVSCKSREKLEELIADRVAEILGIAGP